jgi:integrase
MKIAENMRLDELLQMYVSKRLQDGAESTIRQYQIAIRHLGDFVGKPPTLDHLDPEYVEGTMFAMRKLGAAPRTANKLRACFLALGNFAAKKRLLPEFPEYTTVKEPRRAPVAWSLEQLRALWESCDNATGEIGYMPARLWWRGLHSVMWDTAERIEAVMSLQWSDIDLSTGWVTFRAETRKNRAADHQGKLHFETVELLKTCKRAQAKSVQGQLAVFPWTLGRGTLYYYYNKILERAGLPTDRTCKFHRIRKSAATHFEALGGNATSLLGHADGRVTKRHYLDVRFLGLKSASDILARPDAVSVVHEANAPEGVG